MEIAESMEPIEKNNKFRNSSRYIQSSFIIAIILSVLTLLTYGVYQWLIMGIFGDYSVVSSYIIFSLLLVIAIIGAIFSGLSFREGKNVYGIFGFIINLLNDSI